MPKTDVFTRPGGPPAAASGGRLVTPGPAAADHARLPGTATGAAA